MADVIYKPGGAAGEYAEWACNLFEGCRHGCRYCYAPIFLRRTLSARAGRSLTIAEARRTFHENCGPRANILDRLESSLRRFGARGARIFLCFTCDPCQSRADVEQITAPAIEMIHASGNYVQLCSKNPLFAPFTLLRAGDELWTTLTLLDDDQACWEPNIENNAVSFRLVALDRAHRAGIRTAVSFEPVIDPDQTLELIALAAPYLDRAFIGRFNHLSSCDWPSDDWRARIESIDWPQFRAEAVALCEWLGLEYTIKEDSRG